MGISSLKVAYKSGVLSDILNTHYWDGGLQTALCGLFMTPNEIFEWENHTLHFWFTHKTDVLLAKDKTKLRDVGSLF